MAIVAGIDEAGLGPLLGPFAVAATVFGMDEEMVNADLWEALAPHVSAKKPRKGSSIAIGDSKKLYSHKSGTLVHLEHAVLAAFAISNFPDGKLPEDFTFRSLLSAICQPALAEIDNYPWYKGKDAPMPLDASNIEINLRANALLDALSQKQIKLLGINSRILNVRNYNENIEKTDNKAVTVSDQTFFLMDWVWRNRPAGENVYVFIDRQGGREKYLNILRRIYPDSSFCKVLIEQKDHSGYRLEFGREALEVHFLTKGETRKLPIALASMTAKYLREVYMKFFNQWWAEKSEDGENYAPTAGYYTDAMRFLEQYADLRKQLNVDDNILIRSR